MGKRTILTAVGIAAFALVASACSIDIERNAYGRQLHSTVSQIAVTAELGDPPTMEAVFIRAPRITRCGPAVEVLGRWDEDVVMVRQGRLLAATFHPELTDDRRVHEFFLRMEVG